MLPGPREGRSDMYARVATFEGDPARADEAISFVRSDVQSGERPQGLEGAKMLMLLNRETGKGLALKARKRCVGEMKHSTR